MFDKLMTCQVYPYMPYSLTQSPKQSSSKRGHRLRAMLPPLLLEETTAHNCTLHYSEVLARVAVKQTGHSFFMKEKPIL